MGEVYRARDTRLDRSVAIKILPTQCSADPGRKQRFEREAKAISSLNHPNICILHDIGHQDGIDYLVMEYLQGEPLSERLATGPLPEDQALQTAMEIADALRAAHAQGIIHRDLKPGNIMLTASGAKLMDFGLARLSVEEAGAAGRDSLTVSHTRTGVAGTAAYMSPEQARAEAIDGRSDIFSF
ncbi:MAG TPA: serine/threonine-protein kinase, partial [Methylomirabilota bacterium]|nr:serine/threonine-protein kinase [Methylomirabilota bacterium]